MSYILLISCFESFVAFWWFGPLDLRTPQSLPGWWGCGQPLLSIESRTNHLQITFKFNVLCVETRRSVWKLTLQESAIRPWWMLQMDVIEAQNSFEPDQIQGEQWQMVFDVFVVDLYIPEHNRNQLYNHFPHKMWNPVQKIFSTGMDKTATTCHNDKTSWSVASPSAPLELFTRRNRGFPVGGSPAEMIAGSWLGFVGKSRRPQPLNSHDSSCSTAKWPTNFGVPWTNPWTNPWASKVN